MYCVTIYRNAASAALTETVGCENTIKCPDLRALVTKNSIPIAPMPEPNSAAPGRDANMAPSNAFSLGKSASPLTIPPASLLLPHGHLAANGNTPDIASNAFGLGAAAAFSADPRDFRVSIDNRRHQIVVKSRSCGPAIRSHHDALFRRRLWAQHRPTNRVRPQRRNTPKGRWSRNDRFCEDHVALVHIEHRSHWPSRFSYRAWRPTATISLFEVSCCSPSASVKDTVTLLAA